MRKKNFKIKGILSSVIVACIGVAMALSLASCDFLDNYSKDNSTVVVAFDSNGGTNIPYQMIEKGHKVDLPVAPTKEGYNDEIGNISYQFAGWYTDKDLTTLFDSSSEITSSITLYAKWVMPIEVVIRENREKFLSNYDKNDYTLTDIEYHNKMEFDNLVKEFDEKISECENASEIDDVIATYKKLFDDIDKNDVVKTRALVDFIAKINDYKKNDISLLDDDMKSLIYGEKTAVIGEILKDNSIEAMRNIVNEAGSKIENIFTISNKAVKETIENAKEEFAEYRSSALENVIYDSIKDEINKVVLFADETALNNKSEVAKAIALAKANIDFAIEKNNALIKLCDEMKAEVEKISINNKALAEEFNSEVSSKIEEVLTVDTKEKLTSKIEELTNLIANEKEKILNSEFTITVANISKEYKVKYGDRLEEVINKFENDDFIACLYTDEELTIPYSYDVVYGNKTLYAKLLDTSENSGVVDVIGKVDVPSDKLLNISELKLITVNNEELTISLDKITVFVDGTEYNNEVLEAGNHEVELKYGNYTSHKYSVKVLLTAVIVAPIAKTLTYTGEPQALVEAGSTSCGTIVYSVNGGEYSQSIPTGINGGTYIVAYTVIGDESFYTVDAQTIEVVIDKAEITDIVAPIAKTLTYTGETQELVEAGSTSCGTIVYSVNDEEFSQSIPTGLAANSYRVYYKALENENYLETDVAYVDVTISPKALQASVDTVLNQEFTGKELTPAVKVYDGELLLDETVYDVTYKNNINPGTATITITFKKNYTGTAIVNFEVFVTEESIYTVDSLSLEQISLIINAGARKFNIANGKELTVLALSTSSEEIQVKLTKDIALENTITVDSNLVLDLNGHTITSKSSIGNGKNRSFTVYGGSLTVKNGTIVKENPNSNSWDKEIFIVYPNASITLDSVTLESKTGDGLYLLKDSNVLIKNSTINTNTWCIRTDGTLKDPYGAPKSLKVVNSVLNASAEVGTDSGSAAILINVDTKLEVIDSTLMGTRQAIVVRDGEALIINSILKCTAEYPATDKLLENNEWKTGIIVPSAYVSVGNKNGTYPYPAKVTLDGVKFEGETTIPYIYSYGTEKYSSTVIIKDDEQFDLSNVSLHENTILVLGEDTYKLKDLTTKQVVKLNELGLKEFEVTNEKELTVLASSTSSEELQVKLTKDIALENTITVNSNLVLDLNGHTIKPIIDDNHKSNVFYVYSKLTVKNGTIKRMLDEPIHAGNLFIVYDGGELHVDKLTVDSNVSTFVLANEGSIIEILNSTISAETYAVATNASGKAPYGAPKRIIIKASELNVYTYAGAKGDCATLLINTPTEVNIEDSKLTGGRQVVINRCGKITIKDSVLRNTCEYPNATQYLNGNWGSGNEVPAAYLVVGNRTKKAYEYPASCTLDNVDFVGEAKFPYIYTYGNTEENNATLTITNGIKVNEEVKKLFKADEAVIGQNTVLIGITVA